MQITAVQGDITEQHVDAIVNAANSAMRGGGGVDGAIHRAGGPAILEDCVRRFPDGLATGDAGWTTAGDLPARWVIHVVGPNRTPARPTVACCCPATRARSRSPTSSAPPPWPSRWSPRVSTAGPRTTRSRARWRSSASASTSVAEARLVAFDGPTYAMIQAALVS